MLLTEEATLQRDKTFHLSTFVNPSAQQVLHVLATPLHRVSSPTEVYIAYSRTDFSRFGHGFNKGQNRGGRGPRHGGRLGRGFHLIGG